MPIRQLDRAAIRREARELIRTARVSPIKFTLLFLAVSLALSLLDTALTSLTGRIVGVYEGVILALMPDSFLGIMLGSLILTVLTGVVDIYLTPYFALSECGFYLRATAPEEPPRQDRSSYTPEF